MGVDVICYVYIYWNRTLQSHRMDMEPIHVQHPHKYTSHTEQISPCEHFHKPTYDPFHFIKSHVNKSQSQTKKNAPSERAFTFSS